jgi:hypothetical protein
VGEWESGRVGEWGRDLTFNICHLSFYIEEMNRQLDVK